MIFNKSLFSELNLTQKKIMNYLNNNSKQLLQMTIQKIAQENNVSASYITKTLKKMGFYGWKDYRAFIMAKMIIPKSNAGYLKYLEKNLFTSITASISNIDEMEIVKIAEKIYKKKGDLIFVGEGFSYYLAKDQSRRYNKEGIKSFAVNPLHQEYNSFGKNDLIILISASGKTKSIFEIIKEIKNSNIKNYLITINPNVKKNMENIIAGRMHDAESVNEREFPKISRFIIIIILDWIWTKFQHIKTKKNIS